MALLFTLQQNLFFPLGTTHLLPGHAETITAAKVFYCRNDAPGHAAAPCEVRALGAAASALLPAEGIRCQ